MTDYFSLQLRFAELVSTTLGCPLANAVLLYTNFFRRFGLGHPDDAGSSTLWQTYSDKLGTLQSHEERLLWTQAMYTQSPADKVLTKQKLFGCFGLELREDKIVRSHFFDNDRDGSSPLHEAKLGLRRQELKELFAYVKQTYPRAEEVWGVSWLYHTKAYQSLFPPAHLASGQILTGMTRFQGSSSWGQFLDYRGEVKPKLCKQFLENLNYLNVARPWEAFPLPTLILKSPIQTFYDHYGV